MVLAAIAAVLGLLSLAVAIVHSHKTRELSEARGNQTVAANMIAASNHLNSALIAVLAGGAGDPRYAQFHPPLFEWADAVRQLRPICAQPMAGRDDSTLRIERICSGVEALQPALLAALTEAGQPGVVIDRELTARLTELVRLAGEAALAMRLELKANLDQLRRAQADAARLMVVSACGFLFAGLILFFLVGVSAARHDAASEAASRAHAAAQRSRRQLLDAIHALPLGFALYDRDERLVLFNQVLSDMTLGGLQQSDIGLTYEALLDRVIAKLGTLYPERDYAAFRAEHLARFRACGPAVEQTYEDGRTVRHTEFRTHDGGTVAIRTDITGLKRREEEVQRSEHRYSILVRSLSDAVFSLDRHGRLNYAHTYTGSALASLTGYSPEELRGRAAQDLWHPDDRPLLMGLMARLRSARGKVATQVMRLACKDGSYRYAEVRVVAPERFDNLGGELAMTGVIRDVHVEHELDLRLRDRMERLNSIVQSTGALFLLIDRNLRVVMANNGFLDFFGWTEEQVVGRPLKDVVVDCRIDQAVLDAWLSADQTQTLEAFAYDNILTDVRGEQRTLRVTANPVRGASGRVEHIVFLGVDETERRRTELQLFDAARLATLGEMASGIAHEINQPLTVIRFAAESLQEEVELAGDDAAAQVGLRQYIADKCARIATQTERAATIIRDLRSFARRPDSTRERVDVVQALRTAAKMVDEQLRLAHIELRRDFEAGLPPVLGHASRLQQVVINLLLNARDAILEQATRGTITIRVASPPPSGKVVVTVDDSGPGIPADALPRLFEPFFTTKPTGKGTGLGLSISYQIIRQMGGTITAENRPEGGARFTVTLDAAPADTATMTAAAD